MTRTDAQLAAEVDVILRSALPLSASTEADPLAAMELDSVGIIQLLAALEDHFGLTVPPAEIQPANFQSRDGLVRMMRRLIDRAPDGPAVSP